MKTLILLPLLLALLCSCTTMKMWRENNNLLTNTLMTPVKLVEDALTLGGTTTPVQGAKFWLEAFSVIDGRAFPAQAAPNRPTWQMRTDSHSQGDFNRLLRSHPTAAGQLRRDRQRWD